MIRRSRGGRRLHYEQQPAPAPPHSLNTNVGAARNDRGTRPVGCAFRPGITARVGEGAPGAARLALRRDSGRPSGEPRGALVRPGRPLPARSAGRWLETLTVEGPQTYPTRILTPLTDVLSHHTRRACSTTVTWRLDAARPQRTGAWMPDGVERTGDDRHAPSPVSHTGAFPQALCAMCARETFGAPGSKPYARGQACAASRTPPRTSMRHSLRHLQARVTAAVVALETGRAVFSFCWRLAPASGRTCPVRTRLTLRCLWGGGTNARQPVRAAAVHAAERPLIPRRQGERQVVWLRLAQVMRSINGLWSHPAAAVLRSMRRRAASRRLSWPCRSGEARPVCTGRGVVSTVAKRLNTLVSVAV
jgi:hypothetical protein